MMREPRHKMGDPRDLCPHLDCIGEVTKEDMLFKSKVKKHNLTVNLTTFRVWCYTCEKEVFLDQHLASHPANLPSKFMEQFFLECGGLVRTDKKPALCKSYQKLISEVWHKKRPSYVVPSSLSHSIKLINPMFRGYAQQDTQEFLRCLMDQLHEELKEPVVAELRDSDASDTDEKREGDRSPSEDEFLSCDSSSDRGEGDGQGKTGSAEAELLIQDEAGRSISQKERMKDRKFSCHQRRSNSEQVDEDADVDTSVMAVEGGASPEGLLPPPPRPASPARTPEPDNDAYPHCSSRPCSPVHHDMYAKLSNPPHSSPVRLGASYVLKKASSSASPVTEFVVSCIPSWFWGPVVTLEDCLAAFFAADELKGVLCIHLKRFRHEVMYSFKINSHVSFPLEGLDLRPFLAKESLSKVTSYDLLSVICHHGTAGSKSPACLSPIPLNGFRKRAAGSGPHQMLGISLPGGHYIAYCQNMINGQWYEFDDQYVTEVHETIVQNAEAYVLFYRFGGGPAVNHLYVCSVCQVEIEALAKRRKMEIDTFIKLNKAFQAEECPSVIFCISMQWFREWEAFVKGKDNEPPGPIDNTKIAVAKGSGHMQVKQGADYGQISEETWIYLSTLYGGGPEIAIRQNVAHVQEVGSLHGEQKIEAETRAA
ncbi:hypothetical protein Chor_002025 [Crotalus horridus]